MKSRTSFFNSTALRKDITRFAPVWALYLIGGLLVGLSSLPNRFAELGYSANELAKTMAPLAILNMIYAIITAELLFGDLFSSRLCNALHAFPLRRESWFITHTVSGMLFSFVPNLILSICFLPFMGEMWYISPLWLLVMTMEYLFFFGLAAFSAMCTGKRFAMAAVYAIINFLSMIIYWFVYAFYEPQLYGLHIRGDDFLRFCPVAWMAGMIELVQFKTERTYHSAYHDYTTQYVYQGLTADWWYPIVLTVLGIGLLAVALLLYRRRKLESAGDFAAFRWFSPIFCVVFTLSAGALFEMFGNAMTGVDYVFLVVGIIVGYFASQMLLQRTVRVFRKKTFAACAAIGGALVLSIVLTAIDPLGITRWTPDPNKVESIVLSDYYNYDSSNKRHSNAAQIISSPELIEELVDIHQLILDEGEVDWYHPSSIHLTYRMSDGRQIERRYRYPSNGQVAQKLQKFFGAPEFILGYEDWEDYLSTVKAAYIEGFEFPGSKAVPLLEAIKADCKAGTMLQNDWDYSSIHYWVEIETEDSSKTIRIYSNCQNTIAWIKENLPSYE